MPSRSPKKPGPLAVYWDSCVFIDWFDKGYPARVEVIGGLIRMAQNNALVVVTSTITEAEILKIPRDDVPDPVMESVSDFFKNPWIVRRAPDTRVIKLARQLRIDSLNPDTKKLQLTDAIHAATALIHGVKELQTYDQKHLIQKDLKLTTDRKTFLKICEPRDPSPTTGMLSFGSP